MENVARDSGCSISLLREEFIANRDVSRHVAEGAINFLRLLQGSSEMFP